MKKIVYYTLFGCLVLGCGVEALEEAGEGTGRAQVKRNMEPDQIVRVPPEVVFQKTEKGEAILVCAYETEIAFRAAKLKGAISFQQFTATLPSLDPDQEIIFYCA
jgi:hypothetical protein